MGNWCVRRVMRSLKGSEDQRQERAKSTVRDTGYCIRIYCGSKIVTVDVLRGLAWKVA